jgi:hypothetical protein
MKRMTQMLLALLVLCLTNCTTVVNTKESAANRCTIENDNYKKYTLVRSQPYIIPGVFNCTFELIAQRDFAGGDITYGMWLDTYNSYGWSFYETATDSEGRELPLSTMSTQIGGEGATMENLKVLFPENYLQTHMIAGCDIRVDGQRNRLLVKIPPHVVTGFLDRVKQQFGST